MNKKEFEKLNAPNEMSKLTENVKVDFARAKLVLEKWKRQIANLPRGKNAK